MQTTNMSSEYICRAMLLTDSANCYDTLLSGNAEAKEKTVRAKLSFLRKKSDLAGRLSSTKAITWPTPGREVVLGNAGFPRHF